MAKEIDDPYRERDLCEISTLLGEESLSQGCFVPTSEVIGSEYRHAVLIDFCKDLAVGWCAPLSSEVEIERKRLSNGLLAVCNLLSKLDLKLYVEQFDELKSALEDANRGVTHPLFQPSSSPSSRASGNLDSTRIMCARSDLALTLEARWWGVGKKNSLKNLVKPLVSDFENDLKNCPALIAIAGGKARGPLINASTIDETRLIAEGMICRWRKKFSAGVFENAEAREHFQVTRKLIRSQMGNKEELQRTANRCLQRAKRAVSAYHRPS